MDVTVYHRGFHGDLNETFFVGDKVAEDKRKLVQVTYECLQQAIDIDVSHLRSHARKRLSVVTNRDAGKQAHFFEDTFAFVVKQEVPEAVV